MLASPFLKSEVAAELREIEAKIGELVEWGPAELKLVSASPKQDFA